MEILASILSGGLTGILGTVFSFFTKFFERRQTHEHAMEMRELDMKELKLEIQGRERVAHIQGETDIEVSANHALEESYKEASSRWSTGDSKWIVLVDVVRGLTRPVLTLLLSIITILVYFNLPDNPTDLHQKIVNAILYCSITSLVWWFGSRISEKAFIK